MPSDYPPHYLGDTSQFRRCNVITEPILSAALARILERPFRLESTPRAFVIEEFLSAPGWCLQFR
jgi:hypothetical protein